MSEEQDKVWGADLEMGIGAWAWGDRWFWQYGSNYSQADVEAAFQASLEGGVRLFDTAEIYGWGASEELLGQFLAETEQGRAGEVRLTTKFMPLPWRLTRGSLLRALRSSLERLQREQVDLYLIHQPLPPVPVETWMEALADAVEAGLTRHVGVSNYNLERMQRAHQALARRGVPLAANQMEYSLLHRDPERNGILDFCREQGVRLIAYSPLGQGLLTGKYTPENPPPGVRRWIYRQDRLERVQSLVDLLREIGAAHDKTPVQVALNWTMAKGALPIPGAKSRRQAEENAGAAGWRLDDDEVARLDAASA
jgi:aryl-alcohol dehydrogenase-like predicted oxidoreductase